MSETPLPPSSDDANASAAPRYIQPAEDRDGVHDSSSKHHGGPKNRSGAHFSEAVEGSNLVHTFYDSYPSFGSSNAMSEAFSKAGLRGGTTEEPDTSSDEPSS